MRTIVCRKLATAAWYAHELVTHEAMTPHATTSQEKQRVALAAKRLLAGGLVGGVALAIAFAAGARWAVAVSIGWDLAALTIIGWVWASIARRDADATAEHSQVEDPSRATADAVLLAACVASLFAVAYTLVAAGPETGAEKGVLIALALATVALAWASVHTVYALRYASLYYTPPVGGMDFNADDRPDYGDFAYVALTIGMCFQVSDTDLQARPIRRTALRHALLAYLFGTVIVAVAINTVASLLGH
jgi:uncharacterized membrane protein